MICAIAGYRGKSTCKPRDFIPFRRNQSRKFETASLKWVVMKGRHLDTFISVFVDKLSLFIYFRAKSPPPNKYKIGSEYLQTVLFVQYEVRQQLRYELYIHCLNFLRPSHNMPESTTSKSRSLLWFNYQPLNIALCSKSCHYTVSHGETQKFGF